MENDVLERIKLIMSEFGLSERQFALKIGKKSQTVNAMFKRGKTDIMLATAIEILKAFPTISTDWFIMGEGSMFKEEVEAQPNKAVEKVMQGRIDDLREQVAELKADKTRLIAEIDELKSRGYGYIAAESNEYGNKKGAV